MRLEPASHWSYALLAAIFTAGYEGYFTPFVLDDAAFRFMSSVFDDDLDASRVAVVEGEPAGICKLAIRGERGWIAGVGVAPPHRRRGVGEALMRAVLEEARARGLREVWLEVLFPNEPALRLYEKLGFERVRVLEVWSLAHAFRGDGSLAAPVGGVRERIPRERREREPWQRADETLAKYDGIEAMESERAALLFRRTGERVSLLQAVAADDEAARELLEALPAGSTSLSWLNGPEGDPFNSAVGALGGVLDWRQHELVLRLSR